MGTGLEAAIFLQSCWPNQTNPQVMSRVSQEQEQISNTSDQGKLRIWNETEKPKSDQGRWGAEWASVGGMLF
jgi:hypothetical protein